MPARCAAPPSSLGAGILLQSTSSRFFWFIAQFSRESSLRGANGSRECAPDDRLRDEAIQTESFRDGALAPDPESRDSGFDASHRPGMTASVSASINPPSQSLWQ